MNKKRKVIEKENMNNKLLMPHLPEELIIEILSRLPLASLLKFRCASKHWSVLFENPKLIDMKNSFSIMLVSGKDMYSTDNKSLSSSSPSLGDGIEKIRCPVRFQYFGKASFVGSCNGLFCIRTTRQDNFILWNPSTGDYKEIPPQFQVDDSLHGLETVVRRYGFGYDSKRDDYKFVCITSYLITVGFYESVTKIYSLRSNSWKQIQYNCYLLSSYDYVSQGYGVFCNGALHYLQKTSPYYGALIALHMIDETIRKISPPEDAMPISYTRYIDVLDGCLCLLCCNRIHGFEVWLMKNYGQTESWTKLYSISKLTSLEVFRFVALRKIKRLKSGELLLEVHYMNNNKANIEAVILYDPENETSTVLKLGEGISSRSFFHTYVQSSVSVSSATSVG